jgi:putative ABC transport system permease protein
MLKNHLLSALRNMKRNKTFSFINVLGLTIGLTSFLLIALYIFDEMTFDGFHRQADHIYRLVENKTTADAKLTRIAAVGYQVSDKAKSEFPEVKEVVRVDALGRINVSTTENTNVFYEDFIIGNNGFLETFDFKVLEGIGHTALDAPHSVVLTEEMAKKLFGTENALGKTVMNDRDSTPYKVTAVLQNFPANSSISFNLIFSESSITSAGFKKFIGSDWSSNFFVTYLSLDERANPARVEAKINQLVAANRKNDHQAQSVFTLQPLKDVHFYSDGIEGNPGNTGSISYIYIFSIIGLFVLFIACINYMNLTTARYANRSKEIAVRKVAGASRRNLVNQFLSEAFLTTVFAFMLALGLTELLLPYFNAFTEKQLTLGIHSDYRIWVGLSLLIVLVSLLSGIYPALFQSRLKPLLLLKNKVQPGRGNISLRRFLVVFQFSLSIVMIIATMVVYLQMQYVSTKDMGFKKHQLLVVDINSGKVRRSAADIKSEFAKLSAVQDVTVSSRVPGEWKSLPRIKVRNEKTAGTTASDMYFIGADDQFLKTYGISLLKGRDFHAGSPADSAAVMINESAAKALGITEASGQLVEIPEVNFGGSFSPMDQPFVARVTGIVKDFNFQSLHEPVAPMVIGYQNNPIQSIDYFTARVNSTDMASTLNQMDAVLHGFDQQHLFEYHFLDRQWDLFYQQDRIRETIFLMAAVLAILIACLGLFGLATYAAEQRIKEIGIRKVLGASVQGIAGMLSKDFLKLVLIAAIIAFPIAGFAMHHWLQDFAYRIPISWWIFLIAAVLALLIALITVSFQAIRAAMANPVESLRTE